QIETGWTCSGSPSVCTPICGDGRVVGSEQCDDGANNGTNRACLPTCQWNVCGDGHLCSDTTTCGHEGFTEVAGGCNDDACPNSAGLNRASRITPTVTAGQPYLIVQDGYGGAQGSFSLSVTPPGASTTTTATTNTTTTTLAAASGGCSSPLVLPAWGD